MPLIKSAIKKMHQDRRRTVVNKPQKTRIKTTMDRMLKEPTAENMKAVFSAADKATKRSIINKNKAARIKKRASGLLAKITKK